MKAFSITGKVHLAVEHSIRRESLSGLLQVAWETRFRGDVNRKSYSKEYVAIKTRCEVYFWKGPGIEKRPVSRKKKNLSDRKSKMIA